MIDNYDGNVAELKKLINEDASLDQEKDSFPYITLRKNLSDNDISIEIKVLVYYRVVNNLVEIIGKLTTLDSEWYSNHTSNILEELVFLEDFYTQNQTTFTNNMRIPSVNPQQENQRLTISNMEQALHSMLRQQITLHRGLISKKEGCLGCCGL